MTASVPIYAPWPRRVLAFLLDAVPVVVLAVLAVILVYVTRIRGCDGDPSALDLGAQCGSNVSPWGVILFVASWLAIIGYGVWNFGYRQGTTGSSIGKTALHLSVVDAASGEPIGFLRSMIRQFAHVVEPLTLGLGYLWPLWDSKRQTFADKLASTVCVRSEVSGTH
ncbi:RDD family protein [Mycolicibacterium sp. P9-64]|uniref:RDD family protein n=1 Tax=Mycolicibacterium sp. P9-64 TaxID=2024612 RepID=UPI0011F01A50|nr:RDD family protein [Mycolicibacterium sp. P9-64]KAA0080611.1 RDD family protein [Mycolicibacterium sp. P9-64]